MPITDGLPDEDGIVTEKPPTLPGNEGVVPAPDTVPPEPERIAGALTTIGAEEPNTITGGVPITALVVCTADRPPSLSCTCTPIT